MMQYPLENNKNYFQFIADCKKRPLVLFLGAGIMKGIIPLWTDLINTLFEKALNYRLDTGEMDTQGLFYNLTGNFNLYEKATIIKSLLRNEYQYLYYLREEIYKNYNKNYYNNEAALPCYFKSVIDLSTINSVDAIVTYNYDDILAKNIIAKGRNAFSVSGQKTTTRFKKKDLPIYHIHGFLPNKNTLPDKYNSRIVLSFDEYFSNMMEPFSWQTTTQLFFLSNYTCLFIGTSLTDMNMLRILEYAKKNRDMSSVYLLVCGESLCSKGKYTSDEYNYTIKLKSTLYSDFNVKIIYCGDKYDDMTEAVKQIKVDLYM